MSNRDARTDFLADAEETFAFLLEREGFDGPERVDNGLVYHSVNLAIEVLFDPRYQGAYTVIAGMAGEHHRRVNLSCVYTEAGLGPAQDIKSTARTQHSQQRALASQAQALRRVLPRLAGAERVRLLNACHGR